MKKWCIKGFLTALILGWSTLGLASNEVRVKVDPLDWHWEGSITVETDETKQLYESGKVTVPFSVGPGGGPQWIATGQANSNGMTVWLNRSTVTRPRTGERYEIGPYSGDITNRTIGPMYLTRHVPSFSPVLVFQTLRPESSYYEMKLFLSTYATPLHADDFCTTKGEEFTDRCFDCRLNPVIAQLECNQRWLGEIEIVSRELGDCIGNSNGQMVHGTLATASCDNFSLDNDTLHAQCRDVNGQWQDSSIVLSDYFAVSVNMVCVQ